MKAIKDVDAAIAEGYTIPDVADYEGLNLSLMDWQGALDEGYLPSEVVEELRKRQLTETVSTPAMGMPGVETSSPEMMAAPGDTPQLDVSGATAESLPLLMSVGGAKAMGAPGSGFGAAAGVMARDALYKMWGASERSGQFNPKEMLETGALYSGIDALVGAAGRGIIGMADREGIKQLPKALLLDPFGKETAQRTVAMMQYVKANNLPVNATNYLTGPITKTVSFITDLLPGGSSAAKRAQGRLHERLMNVAAKEMVDWGDEIVPESTILNTAIKAMEETATALKQGGKQAGFEDIKNVLKTQADGMVPVNKTREAVMAALKEVNADKQTAKKFKNAVAFLEERFMGSVTKKGDSYYIPADKLVDIYGGIWDTIPKNLMRSKAGALLGGGLKDGVTADLNAFGASLDEAVQFGTKLREADDVFKIGKALATTNNETKRMVKGGQTRNAIKAILSNEDPAMVRRMLSAMEDAGHADAVDLIKKQYLYNLAQGSMKFPETGEATFQISKFLDDWEKSKQRILDIFDEETFKKWDEFAGWLKTNRDEILAVQKPNEIANMAANYVRFAAQGAVAAKGYAVGGPVAGTAALIVPNGFAYMLASLMHNPQAIGFVAEAVPMAAENIVAPAMKMMAPKKQRKRPAEMLNK